MDSRYQALPPPYFPLPPGPGAAHDGRNLQIHRLKNGDHTIGLFHGIFDKNVLTFYPGRDNSARNLPAFPDVREPKRELKARGVPLMSAAGGNATGPAGFIAADPDGKPILADQHV